MKTTPTPRTSRRSLAGLALAVSLLGCLSSLAQAQIRIGQTVGLTGAVAATSAESRRGAMVWFKHVNDTGGIFGQPIELVTLDDGFEVKRAFDNAQQLINQGVIALFMNRGTPHTQALMPVLAQAGIALVGPSTGAMVLHQPVNPWIFNVRATYQREAERAIDHLLQIGVTRVALVQVDDSFGNDAVQGALKALKEKGLAPVAHERYDRTHPDFSKISPAVVTANAQAALFVGSGTAVVDGMKSLRAAGSTAQLLTLSNNASAGFVQLLGPLARGVIVSQVFPPERSISTPMVKQAMDLSKAQGIPELTPAMLEGFAAAKVMTEGLKRAGRNPTRASLVEALNTMGKLDLGGLELGYSPQDHTGLDYVDLSIVGEQGKFRR
jgi:ABC-type branched-subunit amino acid transport system substrate-binding protein